MSEIRKSFFNLTDVVGKTLTGYLSNSDGERIALLFDDDSRASIPRSSSWKSDPSLSGPRHTAGNTSTLPKGATRWATTSSPKTNYAPR